MNDHRVTIFWDMRTIFEFKAAISVYSHSFWFAEPADRSDSTRCSPSEWISSILHAWCAS